ncbi:MAG: WD40 repeat domain-containing protein, partial [Cyanobacteria bacterium J06636_27]
LGEIRGALEKRVGSIYGELSPEEKLATQKIFLKLVGIGGDLESETEWKPIRRKELRSKFEDELEQTVLVKLIDEKLLVSNLGEKPQSTQSTIEIAHEILFISWTTLNEWIKEHRLAIALRNRLNDDVARWKKKKTDNELWGGSKLEQVVELSKNKTFIEVLGGFSEDANQFIRASVNLRERQRRRTIVVLGGFSAVVSILAGFIGYQLWRTSIAETNARLRGLATESEALFNSGLKYSALAESIKAGQQLQQASWVNPDTRIQVVATLSQVLYGQDYKEPRTLKGHSLGFISVSLSPDGKTIASGGDNTVKLWDISTGKLIKTIKAHSLTVTSVSFSPDGKTIASASIGEPIVKLWDVSTGKLIKTFKGHSVGIWSVSFSPDGKTIASASDKVKLWNVSTGKELKTLKGHSDTVKSVSFSPDGKTIASASWDKTVKIWDIRTGKELKTLKGHSNFVNSVSFSPNGKTIASASSDQTVKLWDIRTGKEIKTFRNSFISSTVSFSPDGKILSFTSASRNEVGLWDVTTGKLIKTFDNYSDEVNNIIFSPDGKTIVFVSSNKTVKLWDMNT